MLRNSDVYRWIVLAIGLVLCAFGAAEEADASIEAVWKPQRATFVYAGHTTFYTCSALEQKLTLVLRVIGAHEDIEFDRRECKTHGMVSGGWRMVKRRAWRSV